VDRDQLRLYRLLSQAPFPKSYVGKVFLSAFLGTHAPLLALLAYFVRRRRFAMSGALRILSVTVPATVVGTGLTLWAMHALSAPTMLASRALRRYLETGDLPELPVHYTDRAGRLMSDVQYTVERLDAAARSLEEQATRDYLTGAYNRRAAEERLVDDVQRARRGGGTLSLALFDLDGFKSINDERGHRVGDDCLVHFARVLKRNLRDGDWISRWGETSSWWGCGARTMTPRWSWCRDALPRTCVRTPWCCPRAKRCVSPSAEECAGGSLEKMSESCSLGRTAACTRPRPRVGTPFCTSPENGQQRRSTGARSFGIARPRMVRESCAGPVRIR
jgi:hypothetical protein